MTDTEGDKLCTVSFKSHFRGQLATVCDFTLPIQKPYATRPQADASESITFHIRLSYFHRTYGTDNRQMATE